MSIDILNTAWTRAAEDGAEILASEDHCLELINKIFFERSRHFSMQRNDDCAELFVPSVVPLLKESLSLPQLALSTDFFIEDVHFRASYFTPEEAGAKALGSALSDLGAAGAVPQGFSLGLMLPKGMGVSALQRFLEGMGEVARKFAVVLTGGDLAKSPCYLEQGVTSYSGPLVACITVWGFPAYSASIAATGKIDNKDAIGADLHSTFLRRQQARPGDLVFLIGAAGLARAGLLTLEKYGRKALELFPLSCAAHLAPEIYIEEGQYVARIQQQGAYTISLMDCSDGLLCDVPRLLGDYGVDFTFTKLPLHKAELAELERAAKDLCSTPESLFFLGGEDYALIGSCPVSIVSELQKDIAKFSILGTVTERSGMFRHGAPLGLEDLTGFDHFAVQG